MSDVKNSGLATGLVSYWEFEEVSGTRFDSHGSNDLTDNNTVGQATGIQGNGADFEKDNSEYLSIADVADFRGLGAFSISCWVKPESLTGTTSFVIAAKEAPAGWKLRIDHTSRVVSFMADESSSGYTVGSTTLVAGNWYHIVCTVDASDNATVYLNNSVEDTDTGFRPSTSTAALNIGRSPVRTVRLFDGIIDEFGFWTRALTSGEVSDLYNAGAGIPYDAGGGGGVVTPRFLGFSRL